MYLFGIHPTCRIYSLVRASIKFDQISEIMGSNRCNLIVPTVRERERERVVALYGLLDFRICDMHFFA
jgi:hypothetical protein